MKILIMACTFITCVSHAKIPTWAANNSTKLNGRIVTTVCNGSGPSVDIARKDAINSCQITASQFLKTRIKVKSLSIQTEKSSGFHEEVSQDHNIEGLTCIPEKDETVEENGMFNIWIKCSFNLDKVTVETESIKDISNKNENLNSLESVKIAEKKNYTNKYIYVSTVPKCDSVIVKGTSPRVVDCKNNPMKLKILEKDIEIIIRADKYKPKTIFIGGTGDNQTIQVLLDLL